MDLLERIKNKTSIDVDFLMKRLKSDLLKVSIKDKKSEVKIKEMMIETVKHLNTLDINGIKIHMLHIIKNTKLNEIYQENPFPILTKEEYVDIVCDQLEILRPEIVVHRITGDPDKNDLVKPSWVLKKFCVLNDIDKELEKRRTYQGFRNSILNRALQIVLIISMPAAIGLSFLAKPVWTLFYGPSILGPIMFKVSILTSIMCNVYLIGIQTAQSLNEYKTVYKAVIFGFSMNAIFDVPFMYICSYLNLPAFYGATFATMLGYIVAISIVLRKLRLRKEVTYQKTLKVFLKIVISILAMLAVLSIIRLIFPFNSTSKLFATIYISIFAVIGASIYFTCIWRFGLIDKVFGPKMVNKLLNKMTFGIIKIKGDLNDLQEDE